MTQLAVKAPPCDLDVEADYWAQRLRADGYAIIPDLVDPALIHALDDDLRDRFDQTPFCDGAFYGERTKRFHRLLSRSDRSAAFVQHALILAITERILHPWCDCIQLNLVQGLAVYPGSRAQVPHRDQDMWGGPKGEMEYLVNVMWPFTDYRRANGATILWPQSHRNQHEMLLLEEASITAEMRPGSALLFLGSTLHGAGRNSSNTARRGMIASYCLGWLKPYENQWLSYPPEVARHFNPSLAALVGYRQHRPNLGNFDGQCPSVLLQGEVPDYLQAVDHLQPDQALMIADYYAGRLSPTA